jgi:signal transduction histidine kinase
MQAGWSEEGSRVRSESATFESGHPCCDGATITIRRKRRQFPPLVAFVRKTRVHHLLVLLAFATAVSVPLATDDPGLAGYSWVVLVVLGVGLGWATNRLGSVAGAAGYVAFAGVLVWHAASFGWPLQVPEALLMTGMFAIAQMLNGRGMEVVIGIGFALLFFIGALVGGNMSDTASIPVVLAFVTAFSAAAWTVATLIRRERDVRERLATLVDTAPIAIFDFDLSGIADLISELREQGADRLCDHLLTHPVFLAEALGRVRVRSSNPAGRRLFEVADSSIASIEEAIGAANPVAVPLLQQVLVSIWDGLPTLETELAAETAAGRPMYLLFGASLGGETPRALRHSTFSAVDLSRQKALEEDLQAELAERDRFVASISHELRTPLTSVLGLGQSLLEQEGLARDETEEILRIMVKEGQDLAHIVEDLLVGARLELGPLDIVTQEVGALEEVERLLTSLDLSVSDVDVDAGLVLLGNKVRFRQILRNMLTNAARYGGPSIRVLSGWAGNVGYVDVRDDGNPIPDPLRARMFEPYERLHRQQGTTDSVGLGLTVSRSLAKAMGGDLEYVHDGVEGIFRVTLPLVAATPRQAHAGAASGA